MKRIRLFIKEIIERNKFLTKHEEITGFKGKVAIQLITAFSFLILSVTNVFTKSYVMLGFTLAGAVLNALLALISIKTKKIGFCTYGSIALCSIIFAMFVIGGGNDGFASLWITLLPIFAMVVMDFLSGLIASAVLLLFNVAVFWTPLKSILHYAYNEQFCLRFPIFYFVALMLGFVMTLELQKSQYNAQKNLLELEKVTEIATKLSLYDPLSGLANRRCAYEFFEKDFSDEQVPHTIVMGDIDKFKQVNDAYGHELGDEVTVTISQYISKYLPESFIKSRWGGEEFLIAANEPIQDVFEKIEILREKIAQHDFLHKGKVVKVTMTFGVAQYYKRDQLSNAIKTADERLYLGKNSTQNCTVTHS